MKNKCKCITPFEATIQPPQQTLCTMCGIYCMDWFPFRTLIRNSIILQQPDKVYLLRIVNVGADYIDLCNRLNTTTYSVPHTKGTRSCYILYVGVDIVQFVTYLIYSFIDHSTKLSGEGFAGISYNPKKNQCLHNHGTNHIFNAREIMYSNGFQLKSIV